MAREENQDNIAANKIAGAFKNFKARKEAREEVADKLGIKSSSQEAIKSELNNRAKDKISTWDKQVEERGWSADRVILNTAKEAAVKIENVVRNSGHKKGSEEYKEELRQAKLSTGWALVSNPIVQAIMKIAMSIPMALYTFIAKKIIDIAKEANKQTDLDRFCEVLRIDDKIKTVDERIEAIKAKLSEGLDLKSPEAKEFLDVVARKFVESLTSGDRNNPKIFHKTDIILGVDMGNIMRKFDPEIGEMQGHTEVVSDINAFKRFKDNLEELQEKHGSEKLDAVLKQGLAEHKNGVETSTDNFVDKLNQKSQDLENDYGLIYNKVKSRTLDSNPDLDVEEYDGLMKAAKKSAKGMFAGENVSISSVDDNFRSSNYSNDVNRGQSEEMQR